MTFTECYNMIEKLKDTFEYGIMGGVFQSEVKLKLNEIISHLNQQEEKNKLCEHGFRLGSGGAYCDCWSSSNLGNPDKGYSGEIKV
jgi:hypothetical protein